MRTLYVKFIVITTGMMLISFILAFLISNTYYHKKIKPYNDEKNTKVALNIATFANEHPDSNLGAYLENISDVGYQLYLVDTLGYEHYFGEPFRNNSLPASTKERVLYGHIFHGILHYPRETFVTGFFANELRNTIGVPLEHNGKNYALFIRPDIKFLFKEMHVLFGWILLLAISLSIVMVLINTRYLIKPISTLTKATKCLANGNYNVELDSKRDDELGQLSQSFLQMARKLEQMEEMRKEFISNISHDIQSPLSNIKGYTNLLDHESISKEDRTQYVSIINSEIRRLSSLTKQLLLLASLDRNEDVMKKKWFNVSEQIKGLIRKHQWAISEKGLTLSYSLPDIEIMGDPSLLETVWDNLISNGIKYNVPDGSIEISIEQRGNSVFVTFVDTGLGMSKAEVERIFERFYRADTSRTRSVEGTGLGLSIVASIVKIHNGVITVKSTEKEGSTFIIELPVK
ncbi:HAMP domain-containing sensor histidine kinase [Neobacillus sp. DY30]|uniref:HAMP domain-containing sensor histidine kinase n=1 Tax=Neobacillus sp. DY30 TaxID=3047871 RepID=UPI0024BFAB87|nr:HAMP domain-containing sensor histidine kinase [Neobacillus sp. DY30]WHY03157.1 HAMP domain-containing sensor histidine kinase [Neobacillus sp. DY30]